MSIPSILTEDYNYILPQEKIAQRPLSIRDASKLLVYHNGECQTDSYKSIAHHLPSNSLIILNNSKVIPARLLYVKETSGIIEIFCLEPKHGTPYEALQHQGNSTWTCMVGGLKKWNQGKLLQWKLENESILSAKFIQANETGFEIEFTWTDIEMTFAHILECLGQMPIPPYLLRKAEDADKGRYQTMYASVEGSVAAPTAGLHFTKNIFDDLVDKNITTSYTTLHVGAGTFKPVTAQYAHEHIMHAEWIEIDVSCIKLLSKFAQITSVGTTSLRTIESVYWYAIHCMNKNSLETNDFILPQFTAYSKETFPSKEIVFNFLLELMQKNQIEKIIFKTELMILPGYTMKVATHLVTNFHQPKSTLLMLVNAFVKGNWKSIYDYALVNDYRFLSYGDGCLLRLAGEKEMV